MSQLDELGEQLGNDIFNFIDAVFHEILDKVDNNPATVIGAKPPRMANPFASYMHAKLQQTAKENPRYNALADTDYLLLDPSQPIDPSQPNGIECRITGRYVVGVEESYNGPTHAFLQTLSGFRPLGILYAVAKEPRVVEVYKPEQNTSV